MEKEILQIITANSGKVLGRVRTGEVPFNGKQFLRMEEVAAYFEVTPRTVYRWVDEGLLPAYKLGGCLRVKTSDLEVFEEAARRG